LPGNLGCYPEIILEKQTVDVFTNPNTDSLLKLLGYREIILCGVVTEICVDRAARGLILHGYRVHLVEDAIRHLDSHRAHQMLRVTRVPEAETQGFGKLNLHMARTISEAHISCRVGFLDTHSSGPILQNPPTGPEYFSRGFSR
jgi:hypothetical protein